MQKYKYDWHKIEQEFIHDNIPLHNGVTLKTIAEKYNIPYQTVRRKAAEDKWHNSRYHCYRMKMGYDAKFHKNLDEQIEKIENEIEGRCKRTGQFMKGNKLAKGNKGNRQPKYGNQNALKHGLYAKVYKYYYTINDNGVLNVTNGLTAYSIASDGYKVINGRVHIRDDIAERLERLGYGLLSK